MCSATWHGAKSCSKYSSWGIKWTKSQSIQNSHLEPRFYCISLIRQKWYQIRNIIHGIGFIGKNNRSSYIISCLCYSLLVVSCSIVGFFSLSGETSYRQISCISIGCFNDHIALKFDGHLGSATWVLVNLQSDWQNLNPYLAAWRSYDHDTGYAHLTDSETTRTVMAERCMRHHLANSNETRIIIMEKINSHSINGFIFFTKRCYLERYR